MKLERSWLCFGILGMDELQLKTNKQVCIPLIPLKEIPSQINTSWVEIVSKVFLCLFFIFFRGTMLFHCRFFRLSFNISFDFHQVRSKYVSKINEKLLRWTVPDTDKILYMKLKPGKKNEVGWEWHPSAPISLPLYFQRLKLLSRQLMIHKFVQRREN